MSLRYVDTSALVRCYFPAERDHDVLRASLLGGADPAVTSELTRVELASAISAAYRAGRIAEPADCWPRSMPIAASTARSRCCAWNGQDLRVCRRTGVGAQAVHHRRAAPGRSLHHRGRTCRHRTGGPGEPRSPTTRGSRGDRDAGWSTLSTTQHYISGSGHKGRSMAIELAELIGQLGSELT